MRGELGNGGQCGRALLQDECMCCKGGEQLGSWLWRSEAKKG